ncbi:hypothetical protein AC482_01855 [miscellaneous Crenarchaeota group-15 archaeon DG-45]|uniref:DUF4430 domain-containing protein n=1 Tax=miscellaneous Crenarchaeota group-15 archaeon DG-45 TaxID=1685127 RepID=A0A0M0BRT7_9ARCH|nr:MAG: hypothetical protein AC482_01855 [miscellaneous Crenarchaeota group-15 archaeon DG-45]
MWVAAAFLCTTIASSYAAVNYYSQSESYRRDYQALLEDLEYLTIFIHMKIDYGNGTVVWHNSTRVPLNSTLLTATRVVSSVEYVTFDYGTLVTGINGVGGDPDTFWLWHYWDPEEEKWEYGPVGSDRWMLHDGDIVAWIYTSF